jgi:hypothetical protein
LEAETNKYCPGGNDIGAISNLITWVLNFFLSAVKVTEERERGRRGAKSYFLEKAWSSINYAILSDEVRALHPTWEEPNCH